MTRSTSKAPRADASRPRGEFPVVGLGASAGGILALRTFLEQMPAGSGMAFVVILHLSPKHESSVDSVLQQVTRMPVRQVTEPPLIEAGHVYVISPRNDLEIADGYLRVKPAKRPRGAHVAIDLFFRTLADSRRDRAIGIVLSGTGPDGSLGLARIKELGGVTFAQAAEDCEYPEMPLHAVATGMVDFVMPAAEMPQKLLDIWKNMGQIALPPDSTLPVRPDTSAEAEKALREIVDILAMRSGHDFSHYKRATVLRRIERRLQVNVLKDLPSYRDYLREHPAETALLLDDMLISVTSFFRDRVAFEALERDFIPELFDARSEENPLRAWVAGCATGEEAYSLAILFAERAAETGSADHYQVFATDIDQGAITTARAGTYPSTVIADIPPNRLRRYFSRERDSVRINKSVRDRVLFAAHNLLRDPPFSRLDMVSCRNVMIYLDRAVQASLLEVFHAALRPGGLLFLGTSESAEMADSRFDVVDKKNRIYRARAQSRNQRRAPVPLGAPAEQRFVQVQQAAPLKAGMLSYADVHARALQQCAPPSVVVDREGNIVHMSEGVGKFLQHGPGEPSRNLPTLACPELRGELRTILFRAQQTGRSVDTDRMAFERDGQRTCVNLTAHPFRDDTAGVDFVLVLFAEVDDTLGSGPVAVAGAGRDEIVRNLEEELRRYRARLQSTIELSEVSAEELKASNEELQAINEELRSATEELETSKEELQSVNEELITVNHELNAKMEETGKVNDDLQNFIAATGIATVFVDADLCIKRFTPEAEGIFNIMPRDVGRRLLDITHHLDYPELESDLNSAFVKLQPVEREVRSVSGRYYMVRTLPYRTSENRIEGAVLTFVDVTYLRNVEEQVSIGENQLRIAAASARDHAIIVVDESGVITAWNAGATETFGYSAGEAVGKSLELIMTPEDVAAGLLGRELATARATGTASEDRWHVCKGGERVYCTGALTYLESESFRGFVKFVRNATVNHVAEERAGERLRTAIARKTELEAASALKDDFLAVMSHELKNPLNLISVSVEVMARLPELRGSTGALQSLVAIRRAVRAQSKIINDLLDMSRMRTGKLALNLAPVDLNGLVEGIVTAARADVSTTGLELHLQCDAPAAIVHGDPTRLEQVVWNLLSNSIKFTPEGGEVSVHLSVADGQVRLAVSDTGHGIAAEYLPKVFEMFGQAPGRALRGRSGLGIGLTLVRQLVDLHGGRVSATSEGPGKGATFTVWLPLYREYSLASTTRPEPAAGPGLEAVAILLVEDAEDAAVSLCRLLELEGATVAVATCGHEALEALERGRFDLVLSDVGMAGMDGYELVAAIRRQGKFAELPVVALTGFGREQDVNRALAAGFTAHLSKPIDLDALFETVRRLLPRTVDPA